MESFSSIKLRASLQLYYKVIPSQEFCLWILHFFQNSYFIEQTVAYKSVAYKNTKEQDKRNNKNSTQNKKMKKTVIEM